MEHVRMGTSGLRVSRLALGCMSYGDATRGGHPWVLTEDEAQPFFKQALDLGITFWDTANVYSGGTSEEFTGRAIKKLTSREKIVLATKVHGVMSDDAGGSGLSRRAIMQQVDASLRRLGTDWIDLYQIHRWDPEVPIEETMAALDAVVQSGKVRYIGASSMWAWQFSKAQYVAKMAGTTQFISMQDQYSLLQREEEAEMFPLLLDQGVGEMVWSPLGRGKLCRPAGEATKRNDSDRVIANFFTDHDRDKPVIDAVQQVAEARGVPMAQVALAWVLRNPAVTSPIIGATKPHHLSDAVAALELELSEDEVARLEAPYTWHRAEGFE